MGWWKADAAPDAVPSTTSSNDPASACPVDEKTRNLWLQTAKESQSTPPLPPSHPPLPTSTALAPAPSKSTAGDVSTECSSDRIVQSPLAPSDRSFATPRPLSHAREVSSIPRSAPLSSSSIPANAESETGTSSSGMWIYPSESQFYQAVMRKQTTANPTDLAASISHIIPIHNAVNERAWTMIKAWEQPYSTPTCPPKLRSFQGLGAGALSPKARLKTWMGYTEPFDRHDWTVERCGGGTVEYVIDFYQGKADSVGATGQKLNFYLDVRPKLNSLEGAKMRVMRFCGLA